MGDYFIAVSREIEEHLVRRYAIGSERIEYIPGGVHTSVFRPGPKDLGLMEEFGLRPDDCVVLLSGRVDPIKGVDQAIRAFAVLARRLPNAKMILRGLGWSTSDTHYSQSVASLIRDLGLDDRIMRLPGLPHAMMPQVYRLADIMFMPSLYEGTPLAALESLACGTPVVASAVGGLRDVIDDSCGILVQPRDVGGFADALQRLLTDSEKREVLARGAAERAQDYSWPKIADRIVSVYERALSS